MKKWISFIAFFLVFVCLTAFEPQISRKAQREKERNEKRAFIDSLIHSDRFVFIATRAFPQGWSSVDLTTNQNYIRFSPDTIESYMPFFGRAYAVEYGGGEGLKFKGAAVDYKVERKNTGYEVSTSVVTVSDNFRIFLKVSTEGSASLYLNSNQRSHISYDGAISEPEQN